jgi:uncharacterized protein YndB with AHSA1/START domain
MVTASTSETVQAFSLVKEILIDAPRELAFEAVLEELGPAGEIPGGKPMPMVLEAWPGGRWFRDLGNKTGHLWGHVQVIKPPSLLEICGPLFMSYASANHIQYRLASEGNKTRLTLTHRAVGLISDEHREGVATGWEHRLKKIRNLAEQRLKNS